MSSAVSLLSQLYHLSAYNLKQPKMQLAEGMLILSIDVDVGAKALGMVNKGRNDNNVHPPMSECTVGEIEERALPLLVDLFNDFEMPATFAMRGQLTEVDNSLSKLLRTSAVKHDIGAHGYYHKHFTSLSQTEAENELRMISIGMKKFDIVPRSFVFPANKVAHLDLLEKYGYNCYRGYGDFTSDSMYIEKVGSLYNIHPSLYLGQSPGSVLLKKVINIAITRRLPFHLWFHLWNLGGTSELIRRNIKRVLVPLLEYAKKREKRGELKYETMLSAARKVESLYASDNAY